MSDPTPSPPTSPDSFPCSCGVRASDAGTVEWIRSPWTGRVLELPRELVPAELRGRIAQAAGKGVRIVRFSRSELTRIARANPPTPAPQPQATEPSLLARTALAGVRERILQRQTRAFLSGK